MTVYSINDQILSPEQFTLINLPFDEDYRFLSDQLPERVKEIIESNVHFTTLQQIDTRNGIKTDCHNIRPAFLVCKLICQEDMTKVIMLIELCKRALLNGYYVTCMVDEYEIPRMKKTTFLS